MSIAIIVMITLIVTLIAQLIILLAIFDKSAHKSTDYTQLATRDIFMTRDKLYKRD